MRPIEQLLTLSASWLEAINSARLLADEAEDLYDSTNVLDSDPNDPTWARTALRVLSVTRAIRSKMNQRFDSFERDVILYYRAYLVECDETAQGAVYENAIYIVKRWTNNPGWEPVGRAPNLRSITEFLEELGLPVTEEIQILGEIHKAITEAKERKSLFRVEPR